MIVIISLVASTMMRMMTMMTMMTMMIINDIREVAWALVTWSKEGLDEVARYGEAR